MQKFMNRATSFYQFLRLGAVFLIAIPSWMCKQAFGMLLRPWNARQLWKQFWVFCQKMQVLFLILGAAFLFLGLGLQCVYMCECIRSKKSSPNPCIQWFWIFDFHDLFQSFFLPSNHCQLLRIFPYWVCTKSWGHDGWKCCIKRFERCDLLFLSYLILIKWLFKIPKTFPTSTRHILLNF